VGTRGETSSKSRIASVAKVRYKKRPQTTENNEKHKITARRGGFSPRPKETWWSVTGTMGGGDQRGVVNPALCQKTSFRQRTRNRNSPNSLGVNRVRSANEWGEGENRTNPAPKVDSVLFLLISRPHTQGRVSPKKDERNKSREGWLGGGGLESSAGDPL